MELRQRIQSQFELAALPGTKEEDMRRALHFVVVGGGPTGKARSEHHCRCKTDRPRSPAPVG